MSKKSRGDTVVGIAKGRDAPCPIASTHRKTPPCRALLWTEEEKHETSQ
jgi:hypothetical protein